MFYRASQQKWPLASMCKQHLWSRGRSIASKGNTQEVKAPQNCTSLSTYTKLLPSTVPYWGMKNYIMNKGPCNVNIG